MRVHNLAFGFPVPGAQRVENRWLRRWEGCEVMGVVNVTPDSFSDGGRGAQAATQHALTLLAQGASVLDIGGESTRPGAQAVSAAQELDRVLPVLRALRGCGALLSIDTMKPEVAHAALQEGAHLVNDVSGLRDPAMVQVCAEHGASACIMHMQGEPRTMQDAPHYVDVAGEVRSFLRDQAALAQQAGVPGVLLDIGLGFGKTLDHNLALLRALPELTCGEWPVVVGASRKRFLGVLGGDATAPAHTRDSASLAAHLYAARCGAAMVRVHDVMGHVGGLKVQAALEAGRGA